MTLPRIFTFAFSVLAVAAYVDDSAPLAYVFGVVAFLYGWWAEMEPWRRKYARYDSMRPPAELPETLDQEVPGESSQTRPVRGVKQRKEVA